MLSKQSLNKVELLRLMREAVTTFCARRRLPIIPVRYSAVESKSGLEFDIHSPAVLLSNNLPGGLVKHPDYARVWYLLSALAHETTHYQQYIRLRKKGIPIRAELFDEEEAYLAGQQHADSSIGKYSKGEINPLLETLGTAAVTGAGLGIGFMGIKALTNRREHG